MLVGASIFALSACGDNTPSSALTDSQWGARKLEALVVNLLLLVRRLKNQLLMRGLLDTVRVNRTQLFLTIHRVRVLELILFLRCCLLGKELMLHK